MAVLERVLLHGPATEVEVGQIVHLHAELCGCYFDQKTTGHTSCQSCVAARDCPAGAPACNYGYCEAR